jgi:hypothetical protein
MNTYLSARRAHPGRNDVKVVRPVTDAIGAILVSAQQVCVAVGRMIWRLRAYRTPMNALESTSADDFWEMPTKWADASAVAWDEACRQADEAGDSLVLIGIAALMAALLLAAALFTVLR